MEFEQNKQPDTGIDDMTRLAATTRQLTISPIHESIAAEQIDKPTTDTTVGTIPSETEATLALSPEAEKLEQSVARKNHWLALTISIITMAMMGAGVYFGLFLNR
jgi:hypothetical protein